MASESKTSKAGTAAKSEPAAKAAKSEAAPKPDSASAAPAGKATESTTESKADASEKSAPDAPPASYSRGEGQKPVSQAYRDNWNAIFGKKKKR